MAKGSETPSRVASCADYNSSDEEEVPETRKQANISVKRSGDLGKEIPNINIMPTESPRQRATDLQSDSGYSSRTQATVASADSGKSAKNLEKATTCSDVLTVSSSGSGTRKSSSKKGKKCTDPNCTKNHRGRASKTASTVSKSPAKPSARSRSRAASPKRRPRPVQIQQEPPSRPIPRNRSQSTSYPIEHQQRPHSFYDGMQYPLAGLPRDPRDPRSMYYRQQGHPQGAPPAVMVVNRSTGPVRPRPTQYYTEMSARVPNGPERFAAAAPLIHQREQPKAIISARVPTKQERTPRRQKVIEPVEDDEEDSEEETESEDDDDELEAQRQAQQLAKLRQYQSQQEQKQAAEQRRQLVEQHRAKAAMDRHMMPPPSMAPPSRPQTVVTGGFSMRHAPTPKITHGNPLGPPAGLTGGDITAAVQQALLMRPDPQPTGHKSSSYPIPAAGPSAHDPRRNTLLGPDHSATAIMAAHQHQMRQERRLSQSTLGYDPDLYALQQRFDSLEMEESDDDEDEDSDEFEDRLHAAQRHIENATKTKPPPSLSENTLRKSGFDKETASMRSKKSSKDGSSVVGRSRRRQSVVTTSRELESADGIHLRVDATKSFQGQIGGQEIRLQPNAEGTIDVYVGGSNRREPKYHSSKTSTSTGSKAGKRLVLARHDDDDSESEEDSDLEHEYRKESHRERRGQERRRAEYDAFEAEPPRRRASVRARSPDERSRTGPLRGQVDPRDERRYGGTPRRERGMDDERRYREPQRRDRSIGEDRYERRRGLGPDNDRVDRYRGGRDYDPYVDEREERRYGNPLYNGPGDDYPRSPPGKRYSQGYGAYEPPSPRPGYGYN